MVKNLPVVQETWVWSLGQEDPLEKGMATHSSVVAWRIPWTEEPGGLHSRGSKARLDWVTGTFTFTFRVIINRWKLSTAWTKTVFWLFYLSIVSFSLCFCLPFCSVVFFCFPFHVLCLCSRFIFCGYCEVGTNCLVGEIVLFLPIASYYLHLLIWASSFSASSFVFLLSQIMSLCCVFTTKLK